MADALVFDSGVGGLSVCAEMHRLNESLTLDYVCDNEALPYGTQPDGWLKARIVEVCVTACRLRRPRVLVVACNTASTLALEALREALAIPVIGTVPAIRTAAAMTRSGAIGLLATRATIHRPYIDLLIDDFARDCRVIRVAGDALVLEAERRLVGLPPCPDVIRAAIAPFWETPGVDVVVLGCTHFPLLRTALVAEAPRDSRWIDSGQAIARRLLAVLDELPLAVGRSNLSSGLADADAPEHDVPGENAGGRSLATRPDAPGLAGALAGFGFAAPEVLTVGPVPIRPGV